MLYIFSKRLNYLNREENIQIIKIKENMKNFDTENLI